MVANILPADPRTRWEGGGGFGVELSKVIFFRTWSCCISYQIKLNHECSNMVANIRSSPTPPPLGPREWGQNSSFSEHGHVAYQVNWNHECSNMVGHILPADLAQTLGVGSKFNFFRTWSCCISYQIKWNHECSNMAANILVVPTPTPRPREWGQNSSFSEPGHVAYHLKLNGMPHAATW